MSASAVETAQAIAVLIDAESVDRHFAQAYIITPDIAKTILESNTNNRSLNQRRVDGLVQQIMSGEFVYNGQPIVLATDGRLVDGQHRLNAIVRSGVAVEMLVAFNCDDKSAQDTIDINMKRTLAQQLAIHGEKNNTTLASALSLLHELLNNGEVGQSCSLVTNREAIQLLAQHPGLRDSVRLMNKVSRPPVRYPPALAACLHYVFGLVDVEDSDRFWDVFESGQGGPGDEIIVRHREQMLTHANRPKTVTAMNRRIRAALTIKTWNGWRAGESRRVISFKPTKEPFPDWMQSMRPGF